MDNLIRDHIEDFGVEPIIIGLLFYSSSELFNEVKKAIENGEPYNEYEQLSNKDKELYDKGLLLF